jgi:hypothetical protein
MKDMESKSKPDLEWEQRTLCADESCIGVIGPDGLCKECGLPFSSRSSDKEKQASSAEIAEETTAEDLENETDDDPTDAEWEQRTLCMDESCIGVIGRDGRCKECGLPLS